MAELRVAVLLGLLFIDCSTAGYESVGECPPWFERVNSSNSSGYCACAQPVKIIIECDQKNQKSFLRQASCVFYDSERSDIFAASCPYIFPQSAISKLE